MKCWQRSISAKANAQRNAEIAVGVARDVETLARRGVEQDIAFVGDVPYVEGQPVFVIGIGKAEAGVPDALAFDWSSIAQIENWSPV